MSPARPAPPGPDATGVGGRATLAVLASAALFGTTGTAQALGPGAPPPAVGAARILVGAALLVALALATGVLRRGRGWPWRPVAVAGLGVAAYQACFFSAVDRTGVAVGTIVALGSAPAATGLLGLALRGERPGRRWALATAGAVTGSALLVAPGGDVGVDALGVALALGAGSAYALYTLCSKSLLDRGHAPTAVMAVAFGAGAVLLAPVLAGAGTGWLHRPEGMALAVYLGVAPTALAYVLFARGLARLRPATVATLTLAEPLTAAALGLIVLGERAGPATAAGALLVLAGLVVLAAPARRGASRPAPG